MPDCRGSASTPSGAGPTPASAPGARSLFPRLGFLFCGEPRRSILLFRPQHLSSFQVDKVRLRARQACDGLIRSIIIGHVFSGQSLHGFAGVRAAIEKGRRHRLSTKKKAPRWLGTPKWRTEDKAVKASASGKPLSIPGASQQGACRVCGWVCECEPGVGALPLYRKRSVAEACGRLSTIISTML